MENGNVNVLYDSKGFVHTFTKIKDQFETNKLKGLIWYKL